jgi:hypothetical protein
VGGIDLTFFDGGTLTVTVDPRAWFNEDIDFGDLPRVTDSNCQQGDPLVAFTPSAAAQYCIPDTNFASGAGAREGVELFTGILTGGAAAYSVTYTH